MNNLDKLLKNPNFLRAINKISIPTTSDPVNLQIYWFQSHRYNEDSSTFFFKSHSHSFIEAHFILNGEMTYQIEEKSFTVKKGNFIIIPKNLTHTITFCSENLFKLSLSFDVSPVEGQQIPNDFFEIFNADKCYNEKISNTMLTSIDTIHKHSTEKNTFIPYIISNDIFKLLSDIYAFEESSRISTSSPIAVMPVDTRYICAKQFIKDNITKHISVLDVAQNIHLSVKQLNRLFFKYENKSTFEYIQEKLCSAAKEMLLNEVCSVGEISEKLGFNDEFYFNRYFKKHMGITPLKFRTINGKIIRNK